jgi:uncharacterized protein YbaA (DUF1428 family)
MTHVDGFLLAVPTANKSTYRALAQTAAEVFKEYGALSVVEGWGSAVPDGKVNSMNSAVLRKPDETVVFSWITWPSKAVRDAGMAKAMADPRLQAGMDTMPFDGQRMIFGEFETILEA